jgi:hypothetical protein
VAFDDESESEDEESESEDSEDAWLRFFPMVTMVDIT